MRRFSLPDRIRLVDIHGVLYYIAWENLHPGCSFFLRTTASAEEVEALLAPASRALRMTLRAVNRVEFDCYGVRVWRL